MKVKLAARLIEWHLPEEIFEIPEVDKMPLIDFINAVVKHYGKEDIIVCRMNEDANVTILCNNRLTQLTDFICDGDSVLILTPILGG